MSSLHDCYGAAVVAIEPIHSGTSVGRQQVHCSPRWPRSLMSSAAAA